MCQWAIFEYFLTRTRLGGNITEDLVRIVNHIQPLGYQLFAVDDSVKTYIEANAQGNVKVEVIHFPVDDKRALREVFKSHDIRCVFNLASERARDLEDPDYVMRRNAVDFGIPLFMEPKVSCADGSGG
jgi:carbamoyl-phosphate synthase large subunit